MQPFHWSNPAPAFDGSPIAPWRVSNVANMLALLTSLGYADTGCNLTSAYVEHDGAYKLWVGLRDNYDPVAHSAALATLADVLRSIGLKVRPVTARDHGGRVVALHVLDTYPKGARLSLV